MDEVWRPVVGFEDYYEVSTLGNVKSLRTGKNRKPVPNTATGYMELVLKGEKGNAKTKTIHRIVAEAFLCKTPGQDCVNHKNEIKTDNRAANLEWCTKRYNNTYNGKARRLYKPVVQVCEETGEETRWASALLAESAGIANHKNISACCRGLRPRAGGYKWRFE